MSNLVCVSPSQQEHNPYTGSDEVEAHAMRAIGVLTVSYLRAAAVSTILVPDYTALSEPYDFRKAVDFSNAHKATVHLALHSNAGGGRGTVGFYESAAGRQLTTAIVAAVAPVSPGGEAALSVRPAPARWAELHSTSAVATLVELEFHDWAIGAASLIDQAPAYARAIADGTMKYLGVKPPSTVTPTMLRIRSLFLSLAEEQQEWVLRYINRWHERGA